jgi:hypothetical protein
VSAIRARDENAMKSLSLVFVQLAVILIFTEAPVRATTIPMFNQCPKTGQALGCAYLYTINSNGTNSFLFDPNIKDVDDREDVLVGVQNNSKYAIPPFHWHGIAFPGLAKGAHAYLELKDSFDDGEPKNDDRDDDDPKQTTPEPSSVALLGSGLVAFGILLRRTGRS